MDSLNAIKAHLRQHYGSEQFFHGMIKNCCFTEGMKDYYGLAQCYWLHDILQTEFHDAVSKEEPDTYDITLVVKDEEASITMTDYKDRTIYKRFVDFTDHLPGTMKFIMGWDGERSILCLPSEN